MTLLNELSQTSASTRNTHHVDLAERYRPGSGPTPLTGVQAIARLLAEQHERDRRAGKATASFVSGYPGSPLAGLDKLLAGLPELTEFVHLTPGLNEELAATSVWGSQNELPAGESTHDGVVGVWYGKGPGLDRASDAFRHGNMFGANPNGGALVLVGDDPGAKSSSLPCASERSLAGLGMPVYFPRNAEEVIEFGLHAIAMSRATGFFASMKIVTEVAEGLWTLNRDFADYDLSVPEIEWDDAPWTYTQRIAHAPPDSVKAEADLFGPRAQMLAAFTEAHPVDVIEVNPDKAWLGIVAVGCAYDAVRESLSEMGLDEEDLHRHGIRILRVGMPSPLAEGPVRELAEGVEKILVVEEKESFVETQLKNILYSIHGAPPVVGKRDSEGRAFVPAAGVVNSTRIAGPLRRLLRSRVDLRPTAMSPLQLTVLPTQRTAHFCSGCPHNRSTAVPEGSLAGGGIGCHALVTMSSREDTQVTAITHMGGEGAQWIGQAPFTSVNHIFQNVGDGTYFHSGQLAVQACQAAGVNITYKILYNAAVAMTGAQHAEGALTVPQLAHKLTAEGIEHIIVCADEPDRYPRRAYPRGVKVYHRDRLDEAQRELREIPGVTVLIYDQPCAADARRKRKRGLMEAKRTRVIINEAVCEGCGDCGEKSNCLSVHPIDTEFGRKTTIDQTSCNTDYSCLDGDCPSFVTVEMPDDNAPRPIPTPPAVEDAYRRSDTTTERILIAGIGGTGVVTVNQVLGLAALRSGLHVEGLDQTGLSQKAGPVVSHLVLRPVAEAGSNFVAPGAADCVLALDLLTAVSDRNIGFASPTRTSAVASTSVTPTGAMIHDTSVAYPEDAELLGRLERVTKDVFTLDGLAAAEALFGDTTAANLLIVGAAHQLGQLPIPAEDILQAIAANGVAVEMNQAAFNWGRVAVADPEAFAVATRATRAPHRSDDEVPVELMALSSTTGPVRETVAHRAAQLMAYQGKSAVKHYLDVIEHVWQAERALGERTEFSHAVAHGLHKLTAYKDEYEVARLLTDPAFTAAVEAELPGASAFAFRLHPPTLRSLGRKKKLRLGAWSRPVLKALAHGKVLRGTAFDPFGYAKIRRLERALVTHYEAMVKELSARLTAENYDRAVAAAQAAETVRGYEDVKLRNVAAYVNSLGEIGVEKPVFPGLSEG